MLAITKYLKAQNDPPLSPVASSVAQSALSEIPRWAGIPSFEVVPTVVSDGAAGPADGATKPETVLPASPALAPAKGA